MPKIEPSKEAQLESPSNETLMSCSWASIWKKHSASQKHWKRQAWLSAAATSLRAVEKSRSWVIREESITDRLTVGSVNASNPVPLKSPTLVSLAGQKRERKWGGERVSVWGMMLGKVLSGLITPDSCNLQVGSRGKSARFTLLRVSICRHYGARLTEDRSASLRNGKQQTACDRLVVRAKGPSTDTSFLSLCEFVSRQLSPIKQRQEKKAGKRLPVAFVPVPVPR